MLKKLLPRQQSEGGTVEAQLIRERGGVERASQGLFIRPELLGQKFLLTQICPMRSNSRNFLELLAIDNIFFVNLKQ